jgi:hypothetical protein
MEAGSGLQRILTFPDLLGFGVAAIMGSGGFNLIGDAVLAGGTQFPTALAAVAALFQGTSLTYQEAYEEFKTNTAESDLVNKEFGPTLANLSSAMILLFTLVSVSVVLVVSAKLISSDSTNQIGIALSILSAMTAISLQGIELNRAIITTSGFLVVALLLFTSLIGLVSIPKTFPRALSTGGTPDIVQSILYFYFVLAGFDALIKFTEEAKNPSDIPRSFYASNALSTLLTVGVCFAFLIVFNKEQFHANENIVARIIGTMFGPVAEDAAAVLSIGLMIVTGFICYLAATRYMYSLAGEIPAAKTMRELNTKHVPWKTVAISTAVISLGILNNHVYTLVKVSDIFLTVTMLLVSAAATQLQARKGNIPVLEGITTVGLTGLLGMIATTFLS